MPSTLRIKPPRSGKKRTDIETMAEEGSNDYDSYLARLAKLIPGEAVSIYLAARNIISDQSGDTQNINLICEKYDWLPLIGLIPLLVIRIAGTRVKNPEASSLLMQNDIEWSLVGISVFSYLLWIYAIGDCLIWLPKSIPEDYIALSVLLWTFIIPYLYKPKNNN